MFDGSILKKSKRLHFIGIGGSGMFPIVQILHSQGYTITGSDNNESSIVDSERALGIAVHMGQRAENIEGAELIVYTAAIMPDNPELIAAKASGIPTIERAELLGYITSLYSRCVCVCGTHGKTTTTAILTQALVGADADPTAVVGGKLPAIGGYGCVGKSDIMVCEACEFQDHFLQLCPDISVILNIDNDHLEYFGTIENSIKSFHRFAEMTTRTIIVNGGDANSMKAVEGVTGKEIITFGQAPTNDYYPADVSRSGVKSTFKLMHGGKPEATLTVNVPGAHNILNAVAAYAAAMAVGVSPASAAEHIEKFHGAGRRFEVLGKVGGVTIVDDYAHHPAELAATLSAAKELDFHEVWAVFQPFTYSRTRLLMDDFASALAIADHVVMSEIMGSREKNTDGVFTSQLAEKIPGAVWFPKFPEMSDYVMSHAVDGDLVITLGCGDVYKCAHLMLKK